MERKVHIFQEEKRDARDRQSFFKGCGICDTG